MHLLMIVLASSLFQEESVAKLAARCDSQIAWIHDGAVLQDKESWRTRPTPKRKTTEALEEAKKRAQAEKRMILWYVPRVAGGHMYRAAVPDSYARIAFFTHPDVVELVKRKFVPLRAIADRDMTQATGIRRFEVVEPAIILLSPEGKPLHTIQRIRTFNTDWLVSTLVTLLQRHREYNPVPDSATPRDLILGGDYGKALALAPQKRLDLLDEVVIYRRLRKRGFALQYAAPAKVPEADVERGRIHLAMGKLDLAEAAFVTALRSPKNTRAAEAHYYLGLTWFYSQKEEEAARRWRDLTARFPESPWAWRAAANLTRHQDTLPLGPTTRLFEDPFWAPDEAYRETTSSTQWSRKANVKDTVQRAVEFLLRGQRANGGWEDSRYSYWPSPEIHPNVWISVSAIAATALLEWRAVDPKRIDAAVERAEKYFLDENRMARGKNEEIYADTFKILYLVRKYDRITDAKTRGEIRRRLEEIGKALAGSQKQTGFWAHEYPNPFCTAAVLHALQLAQKRGAKIDGAMLSKAADALLTTRGDAGSQSYSAGRRPSPMKDSMARVVQCETVLYRAGRTKLADVTSAFAQFWRFRDRLETIRVCDFHSDGELGGFFFFHGVFFTSEAIDALPRDQRRAHRDRLLKWMLQIPEIDGSFLDSHELGKSYGTGMALLTMKNCAK